MSWYLLKFNGISKTEINLNLTLNCGQAFRWLFQNNEWRCGFNGFVARLKQDVKSDVYFFSNNDNCEKIQSFLFDYFRCAENLSEKLKTWSSSDSYFASISESYQGIRLLRQNPVENLFSFICSSNNNIGRITKLVHALANTYGAKQFIIDSEEKSTCYSAFPSIDDLCVADLEESLRKLGFGYRAKYIRNTVDILQKLGGSEKLVELRNASYGDAKEFMMTLSGVGAKVADCVLLGSLDHLEAVPIDIHMFNVIKKHYAHCLTPEISNAKSVTKPIYEKIRKIFNKMWHPDSGWAQLIMFASDLKPTRFATKNEVISSAKNKRKISDNKDLRVSKKKLKKD